MNDQTPIIIGGRPVIPQVGDVVDYRGCFGRGPVQAAVITSLDIHKGQRCASLDDGHWCYLHQINEIRRPV